MESPVAVGGHGGGLTLQGLGGRKEWRVVNESSGRERIVVDGSGSQARLTAAGRPPSTSGVSRRSSRNGLFHPSGSGHSSDSDHPGGDIGDTHMLGASIASQELMPQNIGQGDDAIIYEEMHRAQQRNEHLDSALSSRSMDSGLSSMENPDEALQQRLHEVSRQREQFQHAEVELRAQFIARSEVIRLQNDFDEQSKQHSEVVLSLQGQIQEREQQIRHLELQLEERERELHVNQMETNEAVWAKDGLLREQTNELANLRRDRDTALSEHQAAATRFDAERSEHVSQLENLKDQVREKDRQLHEVEEQSRNSQDIILFKDEQLREAQAWMARAQELDAYHVNTNNTLHAELRDRTEQINQLWVGYQRQLADVERYHAQVIQRLQQELTDAREKIRVHKGQGETDHPDKEGRYSSSECNKVGCLEANDEAGIRGNRILIAVEHATSLPVIPSLLGITTVLPPSGPTPGIHQFGMHQQGVLPSLQASPLQVPQPSLAQLQPVATVLAPQHLPALQHQQALQQHHHPRQHQLPQIHCLSQRPQTQPLQQQQQASEPPQASLQPRAQQIRHQELQLQQHQQEQTAIDQAVTQAEQQNGLVSQSSPLAPKQQSSQALLQQISSQMLHEQHLSQPPLSVALSEQNDISPVAQQVRHDEKQVLPIDLQHQQAVEVQQEPELTMQCHQQSKQQERQAHDQRRRLDPQLQQLSQQQSKQNRQLLHHENNLQTLSQQLQHQQGISSSMGHLGVPAHSQDDSSPHLSHEMSVIPISKATHDSQELQKPVAQNPKHQNYGEANNKSAEPVVLDERSLLACLVRAVPADPTARIRISSTLPNRLGKMLAPLHWHDYRRQYGRLDDFVCSHPELFVIEGDFINLREGAHATFSATTAAAKAAAAAAALTPLGPPCLPTVAVTPVAQPLLQRGRSLKGPSNPHKETKAGPANLDTSCQPPSSSQTGNTRQIQSPAMIRSAIENGNVNNYHSGANMTSTVKIVNKAEGQHRMQGVGSRLNGVSFSHGSENSADFENGEMNAFGSSSRASNYYGNRLQEGRFV